MEEGLINIQDRKNRRQRVVIPHHQWELTAENLIFIEEKYRRNHIMRNIIRRKPNVIGMRQGNIMDDFVMTRRFPDFDGRIITDELIAYGDIEAPVKALWDTGSNYSCISNKLAKELCLKPIKNTHVGTSGGKIKSEVYTIILILSDTIEYSVDVSGVDNLENGGINFLIGMDIISSGDFSISTYNDEVLFSFRSPSKGHIDFSNKNSI